jgi:glycosyltransferase involved in cell wall biosynthesis
MFAYVDTALMNNLGHHANSARHISGELRGRGVACAVLGYMDMEAALKDELFATPWFRCNTYGSYDHDHICGWLTNFEIVSRTLAEDMNRIQGISAADLIYVNSIQPPQFMGMVRWAQAIPEDKRPTVIMEFGTDPGLQAYDTPEGLRFAPQDTRVDSRAVLLRYTARHLTEADRKWLRLATFDAQSSSIFQMLLDFPVGTLPLPQQAVTPCRDRSGTRPVTIGILGHQRGEKGFDKVPAIVARLLAERDDIRVLVHNGWPEGMVAQQQELRAMAAADPRLRLDERTADGVLWAALLDQSDLILCPYNRNRFISSYSAVASEAMANAIPVVVPEGTTMHAVIREFGEPGTIFKEESVEAILAATHAALDDFDRLAGLARQASIRWGETRGAKCLVDTLLSWQAAS